MRTTTTLFCSLLFVAIAAAQTPGDTLTMYFEDGSDSIHLDSIYPAGCWQVGHPNKPVFTSAYSEPNALVTDTLLPSAAPATCYAEYTLIATNPEYLGRYIEFKQQRDMDTNTTAGWVEFDEFGTWHKVGNGFDWYQIGTPTSTDSGMVFTGASAGWEDVLVYSPCFFIEVQEHERSYLEVQHVRFAFSSSSNTGQRDGWMIDNVRASAEVCFSGIRETAAQALTLFPNPVANSLTISRAKSESSPVVLEILRADGAVVMRQERAASPTWEVDTRSLPEGAYALRLIRGDRQEVTRFVVQR